MPNATAPTLLRQPNYGTCISESRGVGKNEREAGHGDMHVIIQREGRETMLYIGTDYQDLEVLQENTCPLANLNTLDFLTNYTTDNLTKFQYSLSPWNTPVGWMSRRLAYLSLTREKIQPRVQIDNASSRGRLKSPSVLSLRLALEHTKRTSLHPPETQRTASQLDAYDIDELVYVGGTAYFVGLDEHIQVSLGLREDVESLFARGTVIGGGVGDPTTIIARECAIQAELVASISEEQAELKDAFTHETKANEAKATSKTLGSYLPLEMDSGDYSSLPQLRKFKPKKFSFELVEVTEGIRIEKVKPPPVSGSEDDDDEEEEEELEIKHRTLTKSSVLGSLVVDVNLGIKATGKLTNEELRGTWFTRIQATVVVGIDGDVEVSIVEEGGQGAKVSLEVEAP
ncbi:hypothetical protein BDQ17DRAFT_1518556 [Cyathus striatus]|nr:hypothetical protein BDQ17DRAFT_1518556 [Cyathus striatus]